MKVLLKECEEARGSVVSTTSSIGLDDLTQSYNEVSSSSEVISNRLVTFRYSHVVVWPFILHKHISHSLFGLWLQKSYLSFM